MELDLRTKRTKTKDARDMQQRAETERSEQGLGQSRILDRQREYGKRYARNAKN